MTELELFLAWLQREGVAYEKEEDDGTDVVVRDTYTEARVTFRPDGTFESLTSGE